MKNIKIEDKTHARLKKAASKQGRLVSSLADEIIGDALKPDWPAAKKAAKAAK